MPSESSSFRKHQFPIRNDKEVEKIVVKTPETFLFNALQPIHVPVKKPITKNAKTLIKLFFSNTDNADPVGRRKSRNTIPYPTDLVLVREVDNEEKTSTSLLKNLCTSEISNDSKGEKLQLKTFHQRKPSVMEQALNNSSLDPPFFQTHITIQLIRFPPLTPLDEDTILNCQKKSCFELCL